MDKDGRILGAAQIDSPADAPSRLSGHSALLDRARRLEQEAAGLRRLAAILPGEMPQEADEALWKLAISRY